MVTFEFLFADADVIELDEFDLQVIADTVNSIAEEESREEGEFSDWEEGEEEGANDIEEHAEENQMVTTEDQSHAKAEESEPENDRDETSQSEREEMSLRVRNNILEVGPSVE